MKAVQKPGNLRGFAAPRSSGDVGVGKVMPGLGLEVIQKLRCDVMRREIFKNAGLAERIIGEKWVSAIPRKQF